MSTATEDSDFKKTVRKRILEEMLGEVSAATRGDWSVLVLDDFTVKVLSAACKMSDIMDAGISLVEDLGKKREPQPRSPAVYFIRPTAHSVAQLVADFANEKRPMYTAAHVFFSSKVAPAQLETIKASAQLLPRLKALKELNLELLVHDRRSFTVGCPESLPLLYGKQAEQGAQYDLEITTIATRLASAFVTLNEFPSIRFQAPPADAQSTAGAEGRGRVVQRVAQEVHAQVCAMQAGGLTPSHETCDLLLLDRTLDTVAPLIHEWTYEAMCYDMLPLQGDLYQYKVTTGSGEQQREESKEALLGEHDPLWVELRHLHIADVLIRLSEKTELFAASNTAAKARSGGAMSTAQVRKMAESLPQFREQIAKLAMHTELASTLNDLITSRCLNEIGQLEQDVVFGDSSSRDVIKLLESKTSLDRIDKLRLLMCFMATHPDKLDGASERAKWTKLTGITENDMAAVTSLEQLGVVFAKKAATGVGSRVLTFGAKKQSKAAKEGRQHRPNEADSWDLSRFQPLLHSVIEQLAEGALPPHQYPYISAPEAVAGAGSTARKVAVSARSVASWAKGKRPKGEEEDTGAVAVGDLRLRARRLVVFVVGGITRSEVRTAYELSKHTGRDILVGSTSLDTPLEFLEQLRSLSATTDVHL